MTHDEYVTKLEKILDMFLEWNKPRERPGALAFLDDSMSRSEAITAIQQLNNEAIGQTDIKVRGTTQNKDNPKYWTKGTKVDYELRQELKQIIGSE